MAYTLSLSDDEIARYRSMAERARLQESGAWEAAGVLPGARVADVGCGAGLVLCELARAVGPGGEAVGVEREPGTIDAAKQIIAREGISNARVVHGDAAATGLESGTFDVVMMRHVLAHNGGREADIIAHLAGLVLPGGSVYLVDVDVTAFRVFPPSPDLAEMAERYGDLHAQLGNDLSVGIRLSHLLLEAGLELTDREAVFQILERGSDFRGPAWAARTAMISAGVATDADFERWEAAFQKEAATPGLKLAYVPVFRATGRKPAG